MSLGRLDITLALGHPEGMATPVFPLRLRNERLRELTREVAAHLGISQNELIEQAIEHEVVARGAVLAEDLDAAAQRLVQLTDVHYQQILDRSIERFAVGEGQPDPLQGRRIPSAELTVGPPKDDWSGSDSLGVMAAFNSARAIRE